ncbi:twin-arginine translocase TatA/TatE family subunit [Microcella daejeonensis]|uniref:twin-arginine translocase TatA/TatE family subunit n=1 Tax=Microcella daejeonensis TaxID=2994971 RepID=UPI00226D562A|nr:twin-arginine translocase TatA/TatE family subunit [Microcella daejeonensis]WAB84561.1 twin-arginine translocase TatA/TatE family subunit [Microcella daejeonensis]
MPFNLSGWHGVILLLVVLLLFAAPKLPQLARSLGQSITIFRGEVTAGRADDEEPTAAAEAPAAAADAADTADAADPATPDRADAPPRRP